MILLKWLDDQLVGGSMSDVYQSLAHSKWDCKYHVVFVPKRRRKAIFGNIRRQLGPVFHALAKQKGCQILEAFDAGPSAHVHYDPAQTPSGFGDWILERKERDCHRAAFRKGAELFRRTLLGPRLRRVHGGVRAGTGSLIRPRAGRRGWQRTILKRKLRRATRDA